MPRSLIGRRVLVTRALDDAMAWATELAHVGAEPVIFPCLSTRPITDVGTAERLRKAVAEADWIGVTSRRGVQAAAALLGAPLPERVRVAAVGPATARAASDLWGRNDLVATHSTLEGLTAELLGTTASADASPGRHLVLAGARSGRRQGVQALLEHGWRVTVVAVYETVPAAPTGRRVDLGAEHLDDILLASPSAVTGLRNLACFPKNVRIFTIGPTTTAAARAAGLVVTAEARRPGLDGLLEAMQ
jgi:uroporphyrinogen-III synthase